MNKTPIFSLRGLSHDLAHWIQSSFVPGLLRIIETDGREHPMVTELIVQLSLRGSFNLIAVDEWLPDRDTLYRSVRRHTLAIQETLDRPKIQRPMTCLQLKDLLMEMDIQTRPTLILNFFYHFYNPDVEMSLRERTLQHCCRYVKQLSFCYPVTVLVPRLSTEDYSRFFPVLAELADEIIPVAEWFPMPASQGSLF